MRIPPVGSIGGPRLRAWVHRRLQRWHGSGLRTRIAHLGHGLLGMLAAASAWIRRELPPLWERALRGVSTLLGRARRGFGALRDRTRRSPRLRKLRADLPRLRARMLREARALRLPDHGFWGSRLSLAAGLSLALLGTLSAAVWSLAFGAPNTSADGTVIAGAARHADPIKPVLALPATFTIPGGTPQLTWPSTGRAAIEVEGMGLLGHSGSMTQRVPIASITKTMTAYVVLKDHPLGAHDAGPTIVVSSSMAALYGKAIALDESAVPLRAGERLTERQALEAMLLASAGDVADLLAIWDRGSIPAFTTAMNAQARVLGMSSATDYTDPTGLAASTVSTMADQLKLAEAVQQVPALTSVVAESTAQIPDAGTVVNYNRDLGQLGIDGIKTGTTAAAGSCLLFSAHVTVGGHALTLLGIVLGMPGSTGTPWSALKATAALVTSAESALRTATVAAPGRAIATLERDGSRVGALGVDTPLTVVGWPGMSFRVVLSGGLGAPLLTVTRTGGSDDPVSAPLTALKTPATHRPSAPAATPAPSH